MGNSYVQVYLDTTPPVLTLDYPTNTTMDSTEFISVHSNENLSTNHEVIIIDKENVAHYYTFSLQNDKKTLIGNISFYDYPKGIATLYVRSYDEVNNLSTTYKGTIVVLDPQLKSLKLILTESVGNIKLNMITQNISLFNKERNLILEEGDTNV